MLVECVGSVGKSVVVGCHGGVRGVNRVGAKRREYHSRFVPMLSALRAQSLCSCDKSVVLVTVDGKKQSEEAVRHSRRSLTEPAVSAFAIFRLSVTRAYRAEADSLNERFGSVRVQLHGES